eukprot:2334956-Alexandrium_andersonii.AAC.1
MPFRSARATVQRGDTSASARKTSRDWRFEHLGTYKEEQCGSSAVAAGYKAAEGAASTLVGKAEIEDA